MVFTGSIQLKAGELKGDAKFPTKLASAPTMVIPAVENLTDARQFVFTISAWISGVTAEGFSYKLDMAPNSPNYVLAYVAGDPGIFRSVALQSAALAGRVTAFNSQSLTEWDVRQYIADTELQRENRGGADLDFAPSEIVAAMRSAAREYNGTPPYVKTADPNSLQKSDNMFLDGTAYFLYLQKLQDEMRHDVAYKAGNVDVSVSATKVAHFTAIAKFFGERFRETVKAEKRIANVRRGWGRVG